MNPKLLQNLFFSSYISLLFLLYLFFFSEKQLILLSHFDYKYVQNHTLLRIIDFANIMSLESYRGTQSS